MPAETPSAPPRPAAREQAREVVRSLARDGSTRDLVVVGGVAMVLLQVAFRAWAVYGGYFYGDDFRLAREAGQRGLSIDYLLSPYDAQFMPYGRLVAWLASRPEPLSWPVVATTSLVPQLVSGLACLWMMLTLVGRRWGALAPLALYLTSAMTMPVLMWWAAGLNQVPLQGVFFAAVAAWVHYLRERRARWLLTVLVVLGFGLLCYVKTVLVFPALAALAIGWFAEGGPVRRIRTTARRYWPALVAAVVLAGGFTAYYTTQVPQLTSTDRPHAAGSLADQMLGTAFAVGAFGGPWRWDHGNAPVVTADPPAWTVHLCWVLAAFVVAYLALRRSRTGRAWSLLAAFVAIDYVLVLISRAQVFGSAIGTEYRYLTDATCAVVLAVTLATMRVPGAMGSTAPRSLPLLRRGVPRTWVVAGVVALCACGTLSCVTYARAWHHDNPVHDYLGAATASLAQVDHVDLADQSVPSDVVAAFGFPYNRTRVLLPLLSRSADFPTSTDQLHVLDEGGAVVTADLDVATSSVPAPDNGCGFREAADGTTVVPLQGGTDALEWWLRIDYLASGDSSLRVDAGTASVDADVLRGLGTLFVYVPTGGFRSVRLSGLDPGVTLCVDAIEVGAPVPAQEARR